MPHIIIDVITYPWPVSLAVNNKVSDVVTVKMTVKRFRFLSNHINVFCLFDSCSVKVKEMIVLGFFFTSGHTIFTCLTTFMSFHGDFGIILSEIHIKLSIHVIILIITPDSHVTAHYNDVIMNAMASQIISVLIVCSIVCSVPDQGKHRSPASLAFVRGIHRWPVDPTHKGPVTRIILPFDDVIMQQYLNDFGCCCQSLKAKHIFN